MERYTEDFVCRLQEAAEAAGKHWAPDRHTEEEVQQLYELWMDFDGSLQEFVEQHM